MNEKDNVTNEDIVHTEGGLLLIHTDKMEEERVYTVTYGEAVYIFQKRGSMIISTKIAPKEIGRAIRELMEENPDVRTAVIDKVVEIKYKNMKED